MADNPIDLVRQAETEAQEKIRQAEQQAARMVDDAHGEAVRLANDAEDAARKAAAASVAAAHKTSAEKLEISAALLGGEMDQLVDRAHANQAAAVKMILDALA
ncbi:MAG: hypothetical protein GXY32_01195 [Ruminococcaceae bacterium]|mgnify:FL=1|nr:hypothetical protein [Oscillospiraceae bacterium]